MQHHGLMSMAVRPDIGKIESLRQREIELDRIGAQDYFGEMALFEQIPRTATIRTLTPCRMLMLPKPAFDEIVHEYPQIALEICKVLSSRIRRLHEHIPPDAVQT